MIPKRCNFTQYFPTGLNIDGKKKIRTRREQSKRERYGMITLNVMAFPIVVKDSSIFDYDEDNIDLNSLFVNRSDFLEKSTTEIAGVILCYSYESAEYRFFCVRTLDNYNDKRLNKFSATLVPAYCMSEGERNLLAKGGILNTNLLFLSLIKDLKYEFSKKLFNHDTTQI